MGFHLKLTILKMKNKCLPAAKSAVSPPEEPPGDLNQNNY